MSGLDDFISRSDQRTSTIWERAQARADVAALRLQIADLQELLQKTREDKRLIVLCYRDIHKRALDEVLDYLSPIHSRAEHGLHSYSLDVREIQAYIRALKEKQ